MGGAQAPRISALFRQGLVFVRAAPAYAGQDGPQALFLLDTGAEATVIDSHLAAQARLHLGRAVDLTAPGGDVDARHAPGVTLQVAGGPSARVDASVTDLSATAQAMGLPLAGVMGVDFLAKFVVELDYRAQAVSLMAPDTAPPPPDAATMRFDGLPFVAAQASLGGRTAQGEFQIDTGSNTAVEFWAPFTRRAFPDAHGAPGAGIGVGGEEATVRGQIDALQIAGRRIGPLAVNLADQTRPGGANADYAGVIGGPAWSGLALTLDFARRRVWLR